MYKLSHFTETDLQAVIDFMHQYSFALITTNGNPYPIATQIPLLIQQVDGKILLKGHLMKNTDHHKAFVKNEDVLVIFTGPHTYVSASWYQNPATASTWNYMTVHAKGKIIFSDNEGTKEAITLVTNQYENEDSPARFEKIPNDYIEKFLPAIVGFSIEVAQIDNVFKLSQNKSIDEQKNIIQHLQQSQDHQAVEIATEMKKRLSSINV
jgi:transcriptional regulator